MNAEEIQLFSQSIAFHPIVAVFGLSILISIARRNDLEYKVAQQGIIQESNTVRPIWFPMKDPNSDEVSIKQRSEKETDTINPDGVDTHAQLSSQEISDED